jgi:hypothetical protein
LGTLLDLNCARNAKRCSSFPAAWQRGASALAVLADQKTGYNRSRDIVQQCGELVGPYSWGVRDKDHVLVLDWELLRQEVGFAVSEIEAIDDRPEAALAMG